MELRPGLWVWYWQGRKGHRPRKISGCLLAFNEDKTLCRIEREDDSCVSVVMVEVSRVKMTECSNRDGNPVRFPSHVLCIECFANLSRQFERLRQDAYGRKTDPSS